MRLSTIAGDPGYKKYEYAAAHDVDIKVFMDGVEVGEVTMVDTTLGCVCIGVNDHRIVGHGYKSLRLEMRDKVRVHTYEHRVEYL